MVTPSLREQKPQRGTARPEHGTIPECPRKKEGIAVVSLTFPCRPLSPLAAGVAAAAAVAVGLTATPGLADQVRNHEWWLTEVHVTQAWQVSRGTAVAIAGLDTGASPTQPHLSPSVAPRPDY